MGAARYGNAPVVRLLLERGARPGTTARDGQTALHQAFGYDGARDRRGTVQALLTTPSGHYDLQRFLNAPVDDLNRYVDGCAEGARILGQQYITWPYLEPAMRTLDTYKLVAERLDLIGARLAKAGLHAAYHNGGGEFIVQNGQVGYDTTLKETDPALVRLQIDLYWFSHDTSQSPRQWFERAPGRFEM